MFYYAFDRDVAQVCLLYGSICLWSVHTTILSVSDMVVIPRLLAEFVRSPSALGLSGQCRSYPTHDKACGKALTVGRTVYLKLVINIA